MIFYVSIHILAKEDICIQFIEWFSKLHISRNNKALDLYICVCLYVREFLCASIHKI